MQKQSNVEAAASLLPRAIQQNGNVSSTTKGGYEGKRKLIKSKWVFLKFLSISTSSDKLSQWLAAPICKKIMCSHFLEKRFTPNLQN